MRAHTLMHAHTCMHLCKHTCMCTRTHTHTHICKHACTHVCIHTHTHARMHVHTHTPTHPKNPPDTTKHWRMNTKELISAWKIIIMCVYHVLINALSAHMIHINLNVIFCTHVEHNPTKTIYIKHYYYYIKKEGKMSHKHSNKYLNHLW